MVCTQPDSTSMRRLSHPSTPFWRKHANDVPSGYQAPIMSSMETFRRLPMVSKIQVSRPFASPLNVPKAIRRPSGETGPDMRPASLSVRSDSTPVPSGFIVRISTVPDVRGSRWAPKRTSLPRKEGPSDGLVSSSTGAAMAKQVVAARKTREVEKLIASLTRTCKRSFLIQALHREFDVTCDWTYQFTMVRMAYSPFSHTIFAKYVFLTAVMRSDACRSHCREYRLLRLIAPSENPPLRRGADAVHLFDRTVGLLSSCSVAAYRELKFEDRRG